MTPTDGAQYRATPTERLRHYLTRGLTRLRRSLMPAAQRRIEQEFDDAQRLARIGSWHWAIDSDAIQWSETLYDIYGQDPSKPPPPYAEQVDMYTDESKAKLDAAITAAIEHGTAYEIEIEVRHSSGEPRWMMARGEAVRDARGKVTALRGIVHDISARRRAERALRESERRFRAIFDSTFQFIGLLSPDGRWIEVNQTALNFVGARLEDVIGAAAADLPWWGRAPDDPQKFRDAVERARNGEFVRYDFVQIGADGKPMTIDFSLKPVFDGQGQVIMLIPEGRDVTQERHNRLALTASETRLRMTLRNAPIGNAQVGLDGRFIDVNEALCDMLGYSERELLAKTFQALTHPDDLENDVALVRALLRGERERYSMIKRYLHSSGRIVDAQLDVTLVSDDRDKPLYFISQIQDITTRRRLEREQQMLTQRLETALRVSGIGVCDWYLKDDRIEFDDATARIFGFDPAIHNHYRAWSAIVEADDLPMTEATLSRAIKERVPQSMTFRIHHPELGLRYVDASSGVVLDESGRAVRVVSAVLDVTERWESERRISENRALLRNLIDNLPLWVSMVDRNGRYVVTNQRSARSLGLPVTAIEGQDVHELPRATMPMRPGPALDRAMHGESVETSDSFVEDGRMIHVQGMYLPITEGPQAGSCLGVFSDVTALKLAEAQLSESNQRLEQRIAEVLKLQELLHAQAIHDELTGLYNRRHFDASLTSELAQARVGGHEVSLIIADLDHFKVLNDRHGHPTGDAVLRMWAEVMRQSMRATDILCRYGGEEFAIVLPRCTLEQACERAETLRARFEQASLELSPGGPRVGTTVSIGVAASRQGLRDSVEIVRVADAAVYRAKSGGRNRVVHEPLETLLDRAAG